jgi:hypothetical protein
MLACTAIGSGGPGSPRTAANRALISFRTRCDANHRMEWWPGPESNEARNLLIAVSNPSSENRCYPESYPGDLLVFSESNHRPQVATLCRSARLSRIPLNHLRAIRKPDQRQKRLAPPFLGAMRFQHRIEVEDWTGYDLRRQTESHELHHPIEVLFADLVGNLSF